VDHLLRFDELPDILTVDECALFLRLGRSSVYEAIRTGEIVAVKIGRRILIPKSGLKPLVEVSLVR
jgi:excisionase family DNA binding protein